MDLIIKMKDQLEILKLIQFDDLVTLENCISKLKMYMNKIDENNPIVNQISISLFRPNLIRDIFGSNESAFKNEWESGKIKVINKIELFLEEISLTENEKTTTNDIIEKNSNDIFIVHGWDNEMKESVARIISKLGLNPIILHEKVDRGRTIIEKFENHAQDSGFAIALLSPDDICICDGSETYRARQNVIFELGYFIGLLGRKRTIALIKSKSSIEVMSDYHGVIYKEFDDKGFWKYEIASELQAAGYKVSKDNI